MAIIELSVYPHGKALVNTAYITHATVGEVSVRIYLRDGHHIDVRHRIGDLYKLIAPPTVA